MLVDRHACERIGDLAARIAEVIRVIRLAAALAKRLVEQTTPRRIDEGLRVVTDVEHVVAAQTPFLARTDIDRRATEGRRLLDARGGIADAGHAFGAIRR